MGLLARAERSGLDRTTTILIAIIFGLALLHHADHVLRVDHSGWPFRPDVTPFTYSLAAYPAMLFALFGPRRLLGWRLAGLAAATLALILAHTTLENPAMQFAMWAENRSLDPHAGHFRNIPDVQSPVLGVLAVIIGMALNVTAVVATVSMAARWLRRRGSA